MANQPARRAVRQSCQPANPARLRCLRQSAAARYSCRRRCSHGSGHPRPARHSRRRAARQSAAAIARRCRPSRANSKTGAPGQPGGLCQPAELSPPTVAMRQGCNMPCAGGSARQQRTRSGVRLRRSRFSSAARKARAGGWRQPAPAGPQPIGHQSGEVRSRGSNAPAPVFSRRWRSNTMAMVRIKKRP